VLDQRVHQLVELTALASQEVSTVVLREPSKQGAKLRLLLVIHRSGSATE
jgi:hypothetical protein